MSESDFYVLYSHNIPVRGSDKSVVYNLHKGKLVFIPNSMLDILELLREKCVRDVYSQIKLAGDKKRFSEYLEFLKKYQLGMFTQHPEEFPPMEKKWRSPSEVMTAIIEFDSLSSYDVEDAIRQLDDLSCHFLELRVGKRTLDSLNNIFFSFYNSGLKSINLILEYQSGVESYLSDIFEKHEKLECILVYGAPPELLKDSTDKIQFIELNPDEKKVQLEDDRYPINTKYFMEAQEYHPYFNKKVVIDQNGNLKNDLFFSKVFGNINDMSIKEVLSTTDIKDLWMASPDKVVDYRDDILRYCRIYTDNLKKIGNLYTIYKD